MNIFFWMNILDFKKMNILFEWIFWIFIKWIIFWTNILVLVCLRQKLLSPNVSNSSEIIQESLVGPFSVHFRGSIREVVKKSKWKFKMAFAIRGPTPPPLMAKFPDIFLPHFFSFAIESYIYETDFTLQKYHF